MKQQLDSSDSQGDGPHPSTKSRFASEAVLWVAAVVFGGPFVWFALIYPLWPKSITGWVAGIAAGVVVGVWAVGCVVLINILQRQQRYQLICKSIATILALSLGSGIFFIALEGQSFVRANFSYFGR
jgi:hypothetical protein